MISSSCAASKINDRKFAIFSMSYVQVMGCSLSPALRVEILEPSGTFVLKKDMQGKFHTQPGLPENEAREIPNDRWQRRIRYLQHFVDILQGNANVVIEEYESGEEEDEAEEEYPVWICHMLTYIQSL